MTKPSRGPWFWILGGCGCLVVAGVIATALLVWSSARMVKHVSAQLEDPVVRRAAADRVLGGGGVPPGYEAAIGLRIPLVGDFVVINEAESDAVGAADGMPDGRTFILMRSRMLRREADDGGGFDGRRFEELVGQQGFRIERASRIADGRLELEAFDASWIAYRGRLDDGHGERPVLLSLVSLECPRDDGRGRVAVWIEPLAEAESVEGTVADPDVLGAFLRRIDPCAAAT